MCVYVLDSLLFCYLCPDSMTTYSQIPNLLITVGTMTNSANVHEMEDTNNRDPGGHFL